MRGRAIVLGLLAGACVTAAQEHAPALVVPMSSLSACEHGVTAHGAPWNSVEELEAVLSHSADLDDECRLMLLCALVDECADIPDPERGLGHVDAALELAPNDAWLWYKRGVALEMLGQLEEARRAFDASLHYDPSHVKALQWRACVSALQGKYAEALADLERALALLDGVEPTGIHEGVPELRLSLWIEQARALDALGRHDEAQLVRGLL